MRTPQTMRCISCGCLMSGPPGIAQALGTCLLCAQRKALDPAGRDRLLDGVLNMTGPSPEELPLIAGGQGRTPEEIRRDAIIAFFALVCVAAVFGGFFFGGCS